MSCCTNTYNYGCVDSCGTIKTDILFSQTGEHIFYFDGVNKHKEIVDGIAGQAINIDLSELNANSCYSVKILNPDGTKFTFVKDTITYDCISFKTELFKTI